MFLHVQRNKLCKKQHGYIESSDRKVETYEGSSSYEVPQKGNRSAVLVAAPAEEFLDTKYQNDNKLETIPGDILNSRGV